MRLHWFIAAALVVAGLPACSSSGENEDLQGGSDAPCAVDKLNLVGSLEGQDISAELDVQSSSWIQSGSTKTFDLEFGTGSLHLEWSKLLADGETAAVRGTITLPTGLPRAGETICVGSGTITDAGDNRQFRLRALSLGPTCPGASIIGSLDGCKGDQPF